MTIAIAGSMVRMPRIVPPSSTVDEFADYVDFLNRLDDYDTTRFTDTRPLTRF